MQCTWLHLYQIKACLQIIHYQRMFQFVCSAFSTTALVFDLDSLYRLKCASKSLSYNNWTPKVCARKFPVEYIFSNAMNGLALWRQGVYLRSVLIIQVTCGVIDQSRYLYDNPDNWFYVWISKTYIWSTCFSTCHYHVVPWRVNKVHDSNPMHMNLYKKLTT